MAQYQAAGLSRPAYMSDDGNVAVYDDTVAVTAALAAADTVDLIKLPGGLRLTGLRFPVFSDLDSGGTALVVKIGYRPVRSDSSLATVDTAFGSGLTFLATASNVNAAALQACVDLAFAPVTFNEEVYVFATVTTAPTTGAAGSITTVAEGIAVGVK